ncbi:MAG: branched-chain amino acid ABC transporter permease [Burkholderiaceae bacterium]
MAALLAAAAGPWLSPYVADLVVKMMILSIFALSLQLLVGSTGLISLGHAAFLGIGAYATARLSLADGDASIATLMGAAIGAAALAALVIGALSLRTRGVYFIMVTLAFAQMAFFVVHDTPVGGGSDGLYLYNRPSWGPIDLENRLHGYYLVLAALMASYALLASIGRSRFGAALAGIRVNERRMRAAGFGTQGYKLAAFVIAGGLAGLAGFLVAARDAAVNPELLAWHLSGEVLLMLILGGIGPWHGAVIGAVAFTLLKELFGTHALVGPLADHWQLPMGLTIIVFVALLPRGLVGLATQARR